MTYILRRDHWGETSTKFVLEGIEEIFKVRDKMIECKIVNKDKEPIPVDDWCIRWATTSSLPGNPKVINKAEAIHRVYQKGKFRKSLADVELAPKTVINSMPTEDMYPVVLRPMNHSKSDDLYIAYGETALKESLKEIDGSFYCSSFIDKDKEFRVFLVSGRCVGVCEKKPSAEHRDDVSWGCVGNGTFNYIKWSKWPIAVVATAIKAFNLSGLDFGAVDVIMKDSDTYVLEINTGPDLSEYWGYQMGCGIGHIIEDDNRDTIPVGPNPNDWRSYVHVAICAAAI